MSMIICFKTNKIAMYLLLLDKLAAVEYIKKTNLNLKYIKSLFYFIYTLLIIIKYM